LYGFVPYRNPLRSDRSSDPEEEKNEVLRLNAKRSSTIRQSVSRSPDPCLLFLRRRNVGKPDPDTSPTARSRPVYGDISRFFIQIRTNTFISEVISPHFWQQKVKITRSEKNRYHFPRIRYSFRIGQDKIVHFRLCLPNKSHFGYGDPALKICPPGILMGFSPTCDRSSEVEGWLRPPFSSSGFN